MLFYKQQIQECLKMRYSNMLPWDLRNNGVGVSHEMLYFKACKIATRQGISPSQFNVGRDWMYLFIKRKVVYLRR
jgi:hypothetical protein